MSSDNEYDEEADKTILDCLRLEQLKSFFLYAGAGSGKTRSLVEAVRFVCREQGSRLSLAGRKIAVITYTNAACDEIKQRLEFDDRVDVSTIHSFAWSLIRGRNEDMRRWLDGRLARDIAELQEAQAKGRSGKAATERARSIDSKARRRANLNAVVRFIYSPTGDNRTRDSLSHAEVIAMTSEFLLQKPGLRRLLVSAYPVLLIDESQDTSRALMDALLDVEAEFRGAFCLGLLGDTMQRIYSDGKERLAEAIPSTWAKPRKRMNHRCPARVVNLINRIRKEADGEQQIARSDAAEGVVRIFIVPEATSDKRAAEQKVAERMAEVTKDDAWSAGADSVKTLALEHLMAARRFEFDGFFEPLYAVSRIKTNVLQGAGAGLGFFTREVLPLVAALRASDRFAVATVIRRSSPLLESKVLEQAGENQLEILRGAKVAAERLHALVSASPPPTAREVLNLVSETNLFAIPDVLAPFVGETDAEADDQSEEAHDLEAEEGGADEELAAWREALGTPFDQVERYDLYVRGVTKFDTHQGVKGREFPRVMVILSDEEAGGFMFAYDKLFGAKQKSKTDLENESSGKETTIDRTRRLFYVTCSRSENSLAVVYYSVDVAHAQKLLVEQGWFAPEEIECLDVA